MRTKPIAFERPDDVIPHTILRGLVFDFPPAPANWSPEPDTEAVEKMDDRNLQKQMDAQLIDGLIKVLHCFGECEGTWYEGSWAGYGVTPEQEKLIKEAYAKRYPDET